MDMTCDKCGSSDITIFDYDDIPRLYFHCKNCLKLSVRYYYESCTSNNRYERIPIESPENLGETTEGIIRYASLWRLSSIR